MTTKEMYEKLVSQPDLLDAELCVEIIDPKTGLKHNYTLDKFTTCTIRSQGKNTLYVAATKEPISRFASWVQSLVVSMMYWRTRKCFPDMTVTIVSNE